MQARTHAILEEYKKIGVAGLGRSNRALLPLLPKEAEVTLYSDAEVGDVPDNFTRVRCGSDALAKIDEEVLILSPSVRRERREIADAIERGVRVTGDCELFFERCKQPVIAVSGSDGKSTTATLAHMMLEAAGIRSHLIGNIGVPMTPTLGDAEVYVAELSSFMLRYLHPRLYRAALTNLTPNHLDWHSSYEEYVTSKLGIYENAGGRVAFVGSREVDRYLCERGAYAVACCGLSHGAARLLYHAEHYVTLEGGYVLLDGERLLHREEIRARGEHTLKNFMCAVALTHPHADREAIRRVAESFTGLSHRCETVATYSGVEYIDSSIDTTPARCAETLRSLGRRVVLILCGRSKGLPYEPLVEAAKIYARRAVITGEAQAEMYGALSDSVACEVVPSFREAVEAAAECAECGEAVLLSPAATSYDAFSSFEERGEKFKEIIAEYCENRRKSK